MNLQKLKAWSALSAVICAALLAVALIIAIWLEFENPVLWKWVGTLFVLFFLSALIHAIMQGMAPKDGKE
jgi:hypothetical protein